MLPPLTLSAIEFVECNFYKSVESHYHFLMRVRTRKRFEFINTVIKWRSDRDLKNGQFLLLPESDLQFVEQIAWPGPGNLHTNLCKLLLLWRTTTLQNTRLRMRCFWKKFHRRQNFGRNDFISGWTINQKLSNMVQTRLIAAQNWHHTQTSSPSYFPTQRFTFIAEKYIMTTMTFPTICEEGVDA